MSAAPRRRLPLWTPVTGVLITLNLAVFLVERAAGGTTNTAVLLRLGAVARDLVASGQWWRLVSSMFLHAGPIHLAANMISLWSVGRITERLVGRSRFLLVYLLGGVAGGLLGIWRTPEPSVGASAAIIALLAPLFVFTVRTEPGRGVPRVLAALGRWSPTIALLVLQGVLIPHVNNMAHAGGFLGGAAVALATGLPESGRPTPAPLRAAAAVACAVAAFALAVAASHAA